MKTNFRVLHLMILCLILAILAGCAAEEKFEVTFDGKSCTVSGPTEVSVGEYQFLTKNLSEESTVHLYVSYLLDGHTHQNLLDIQNEPGEYFPRPSFIVHQDSVIVERDKSIGEMVEMYTLDDVGEHSIYVWATSNKNIWLCGPLKVIE